MELTQDICRELIDLDQETGIMTWRIRNKKWFNGNMSHCLTWNRQWAGRPAFTSISNGYHQGHVFKKRYLAHRLIWFMLTGKWPDNIDHINGNRSDNSWVNLRSVSRAENQKNMKTPKNNTSGRIGVYWNSDCGKWQAYITPKGQKIKYLGIYKEFEDACIARSNAEIEYGFHPNHGRAR